MKKVVDVYEGDEVVVSYPIILGGAPPTDDDFIQEAKDNMIQDGLSPALADRFMVRDPRPDE